MNLTVFSEGQRWASWVKLCQKHWKCVLSRKDVWMDLILSWRILYEVYNIAIVLIGGQMSCDMTICLKLETIAWNMPNEGSLRISDSKKIQLSISQILLCCHFWFCIATYLISEKQFEDDISSSVPTFIVHVDILLMPVLWLITI